MVAREDGSRVRVRIMDFGLARGATESRITKTGTIAGTLSYMSPEQVAASGVDHRSDIYSLGVILYELLTGRGPYSINEDTSIADLVHAVCDEDPQPPNIEAIVRKIQPAADRAKARGLGPEATLKLAITENVHEQMNNALKESDVLREMVEKKTLTITGAVYQLASGRVDWEMVGPAASK